MRTKKVVVESVESVESVVVPFIGPVQPSFDVSLKSSIPDEGHKHSYTWNYIKDPATITDVIEWFDRPTLAEHELAKVCQMKVDAGSFDTITPEEQAAFKKVKSTKVVKVTMPEIKKTHTKTAGSVTMDGVVYDTASAASRFIMLTLGYQEFRSDKTPESILVNGKAIPTRTWYEFAGVILAKMKSKGQMIVECDNHKWEIVK
jgi:hypothetical protein